MNKAKIYRQIAEGFNALADAIESELSAPATKDAPQSDKVTPINRKATAPAKTPVKETASDNGITPESLEAMKYNDLKSFAKKMGVDPTGNREAITERLLALASAPADTNDEGADEPEGGEMTIQEQVEQATAEMSVEELGELLTSIGVSATGKRQALIAKVVKAVKDGKITFDAEDGEESADSAESGEEAENYFPEDMTDSRAENIKEIDKEIRASYKKKSLTDKDVAKFCEDFYLEHEAYDPSLPKGEKLDLYIEASQRMVDDEGEQHEFQDPYEMNGAPACCGHYLKTLEDGGNFFCEVCGQEYQQGE